MIRSALGGARAAGALFLAIMLAGAVVFWLAWFVAELVAMVLAGACVGFVVSHLARGNMELRRLLRASQEETERVKRLMVEAQEQGVYAKRVIADPEPGPSGLRLPFLGGRSRA